MGVADLTPAMKQFLALKSRYPDCILFFRMGDFYEMFFDDAVTASRILDITLTSRDRNKENAVPLCGVPWHSASGYIARLVEKGFKVAICEQMEDPRKARGIVKREVVRVVTPGMVLDQENLQAKENNFIAAACEVDGVVGLAFLDVSTGDFRVGACENYQDLLSEAVRWGFREMIIPEKGGCVAVLEDLSGVEGGPVRIDRLPREYFDWKTAEERLERRFPRAAGEDGALRSRPAVLAAAGAVLRYAEETQGEGLVHLKAPEDYRRGRYMIVDETARENLEILSSAGERGRRGSLLEVLDETVTAMGGRRLRWWLNYPLADPERIESRLKAVEVLKNEHLRRDDLRRALSGVYDLERLAARIAMETANARDLNALAASLEALPGIKALLEGLGNPLLDSIRDGIDEMPETLSLIRRAVAADPPLSLREGGIIREGYDQEVDRLIALSRDGKKNIAALEAAERQRTGIASLKVGYNSVFGYYIEVTKANTHLVPSDYVRKQTLVNAERYINESLKEYEQEVLSADERRIQREYDLFCDVRSTVSSRIGLIQKTASCLADLDVLCSLAEVAQRYDYCRPEVDDGYVIDIRDGRHPVVERMDLEERFVPNDVYMDDEKNRFLIITGPNMAGKSTYIRQVALICLMAQVGGFVPASRARIGVVDRIFTRIGASDRLYRGQSTFMVEMREVAHILRNATKRSLIVLDEVGRGTSTFDGLSIAWAVAEFIHDEERLGSRTLFATHYHQLTELAATREGVKNYNIAVREWGDKIVFLRKIMEGGTSRSYGIQVASLAGVPEKVVQRAGEILKNLERAELDLEGKPRFAATRARGRSRFPEQLSLFMTEEEGVLREIRDTDVLSLTPLEALTRLSAWKERLT